MRDRKRAAAEQSLLDAAEHELANAGVAEASMQAIAARAGVSVGTLYNYFPDRDGLVRALLDVRRKAMAARLDEVLAEQAGAPFAQQLRAMTVGMFSFFDEHRAFLRIALNEPMATLKKRSAVGTFRERIQRLVDVGVATGAVRAEVAPFAADAITGVLRAVLISKADDKARFVDLADGVADLILRGVAS